MAIIGSFTKQENGTFRGMLNSPMFNGKVAIVPIDKAGEKSPDYRVYLGKFEFGAAWNSSTKDGSGSYVSVVLDPHFLPPLSCRLVEKEKEYVLIPKD